MAAAYLTEGSSMCLWEDIFENRLSEGEMVCIPGIHISGWFLKVFLRGLTEQIHPEGQTYSE